MFNPAEIDKLSMRNGAAMTHTVAMGNLLSTDTSTLYLDANSGFDASRPITVFMVVTTRLGNAVTFKEVNPSAILSNFSVTNKLVGDAPFALTAPTTNSAGAFTYSSSNPAVATVSGTTVTLVGAGTTTITATQAATDTYASNSIPATFIVLALANFSVPQKLVTDASFVLTAPQSNSDGAFTYSSSNPTVATVSGSTVAIVGAGTTIITATQAATATYASNSISATFTVLILPTLSSFSVPSKKLGDASFALTAPTSNSAGAFTYSSSNPAVATVSGSTVTIVGAGSTTITATQAATATYASNSITALLVVVVMPSPATLSNFSVPAKVLGDSFVLTAPSSNSTGAFTYTSNNLNVATVSGSTVTIVGVGETTITATQAAFGNYLSNSITAQLVVSGWIQKGAAIFDASANDYDYNGYSVSLNGNRVAIGAIYNDENGTNAGRVNVYDLSGNTWIQVGQNIYGNADDESGTSVSLSSDGTRVAIGTPGADHIDGNGNTISNSGLVRVYDLSGNTWIQTGQDINGEGTWDYSGWSVSLSSDGSKVAIGATGNTYDIGHVRVYELSENTWTQVGQDIDGEAANDNSGTSVSLSSNGNRIAIGAPKNNNYAGHVRVYDLVGNNWIQVGQDIDGEDANDRSGWSVSLSSSGSRVAIGAYGNDHTDSSGNNVSNAGHVRVYDLINNTWTKVGQDIDGEYANDKSGWSVSLSSDGTRVAIGAPDQKYTDSNGNQIPSGGHVRVYDLVGNTWIKVGQDIDGVSRSNIGYSVSLSSNRVAIGAILSNNGKGDVRVYELVN